MDKNTTDWEKYRSYDTQDFIEDDDFRNWVKYPNREREKWWKKVQAQLPEQRKKMEEARKAVLLFRDFFEQNRKEQPQVDAFFQERIHPSLAPTTPKRSFRRASLLQWAAIIAVLVAVSVVIWWSLGTNKVLQYQTAFGEQQEIELPDGSMVYLNANSTLRLAENWSETTDREVWLEGEAFFEVKKRNSGQLKFTVHTDDLDIEVLGTQFNVNTRKAETQVALEEGQVQLRFKKVKEELVTMQPGELITFDRQTKTIVEKKTVQVEQYSSWKEGWLFFEEASMEEVAQRIEEVYGKEVLILNDTIRSKVVQGGIPNEDLDIFLEALETLYQVEITTDENQQRIILQ